MGVVYLGSDRRGQRVALKVIRPDLAEDQEFRSRFAREVSAARRIRGGCTARLVAADLEADRPWFATQYVPGPSLHDKVAEEGPLSAAEVASIGAALSEGLVAVHEAGVVHRDLKPSNILLSPKGPRIIDFGIAWATGASTLTHVGTAVGSPGFLAPEQVRGAAVTPATDVFSLGATLAYAATADSPFGHGSSEVMLYRVVHEEPQLYDVPRRAGAAGECLPGEGSGGAAEHASTLHAAQGDRGPRGAGAAREPAARAALGAGAGPADRPARRPVHRTADPACGEPSGAASADPADGALAHRRRPVPAARGRSRRATPRAPASAPRPPTGRTARRGDREPGPGPVRHRRAGVRPTRGCCASVWSSSSW